MKFFRNGKENSRDLEIRQNFKDLNKKIESALKVYEEKTLSEREFKLLEEKSELQNKVINIQESIIKLTDDLAVSNKTVKDQEKELTKFKEKVKNLSLDYSKQINYKAKYEEVKKQNIKLEKENAEYKERYGNLPKKVRGTAPTKDTKQTIGIKESKAKSSAAKAELKKINELREKEETT